MISKHMVAAALAAAGLCTIALPAYANSALKLAPLKGAETVVDQAHFRHPTCKRGLNGWHRHVPGVGRIQCTTRRNGVWY